MRFSQNKEAGKEMAAIKKMNTKITVQFTLLTLGVTLLTWGGLVILYQHRIVVDDQPLLYAVLMLGGLSPTYVSYIVLKKNKRVSGFKEWLKNVFYFQAKVSRYLFAFLLAVLFVGTNTIVSGSAIDGLPPFYSYFVGLLMSFLMGGLEEAGWRYILQPELDKKYGFVASSVITAAIWFAWHIPLLLIGFIELDMGMYAVNILGMTFFYGAIIRISGRAGVFLSLLAHTFTNFVFNGFPFNLTWLGTIVTFAVVVGAASITVLAYEKKKSLTIST